MKSVLIFVELPSVDKPRGTTREWQSLLARIVPMEKLTPEIQKPVENVWLIPLDSGLHFLAELLHELHQRNLIYCMLQLDEVPKLIAMQKPVI